MSIDTSKKAVERLAEMHDAMSEISGSAAETTAATLRALADQRDALLVVLDRWQSYGCPDCGGDCAGANWSIARCIMAETSAIMRKARGE